MADLIGRTVVITGGAGGQGAEEARLFSTHERPRRRHRRRRRRRPRARRRDRRRRSQRRVRSARRHVDRRLEPPARPPRRARQEPARTGQQRRHRPPLRADGHHPRALRAGARGQPARTVPRHAGTRPTDARQRGRRDRQRGLGRRDDGPLLRGVLQQQVGPARPVQGRCHGAGAVGHPRQRRAPRHRQHRDRPRRHGVPAGDDHLHAPRARRPRSATSPRSCCSCAATPRRS